MQKVIKTEFVCLECYRLQRVLPELYVKYPTFIYIIDFYSEFNSLPEGGFQSR